MLAHHNDITAAEVLAFLSVFLYDGNETVQVRWMMCVHMCTQKWAGVGVSDEGMDHCAVHPCTLCVCNVSCLDKNTYDFS